MSELRVTRRYVQGFLGGIGPVRIDAVEAALERFDAALKTNPDIAAVLYHPAISRAQKKALVRALVADGPGELSRFLTYVVEKKRERILDLICEQFKSAADAVRGRVRGRVRTAAPLTDPQAARLKTGLGRALGKQVALEMQQDAGLLAGLQVFVGSYVIDGSLSGRLRRLRKRLLDETAQQKPAA